MNKRYRVAAACCMCLMLAGLGRGQIDSSRFTTPPSGAGLSPLTPPSTYQNTLVPSRREAPGYDVRGGLDVVGPVPYTYLSPRTGSRVTAIAPTDSFIRRSGGLSHTGGDADPLRPLGAPTSLQRYGVSPLARSTAMVPGETARRDPDALAPPLSAAASGIYRPRSTLSMSAAELQRLSGIDVLLESMRLPTDALLERNITIEPPGALSQEAVLRPLRQPEAQPRLAPGLPAAAAPLEPDAPLSREIQELKALLEKDFESLDAVRRQRSDETTTGEAEQLPSTEEKQAVEPRLAGVAGVDTGPGAGVEGGPFVAQTPPLPPLEPLGPTEQRKVRGILGKYKSFEELAAAKVKEFVTAGDALLKEGKYYKAVDAYALAAVWDNRDPQISLHRAIAHFAAGEFISASLFLERAIVVEPAYAGGKVDLASLLPSRDVIDNRLIEGADWQKRNGSGEIAMLLAWVYQQRGSTGRATEYIQLARQAIPDNPAAAAIAKALTAQ